MDVTCHATVDEFFHEVVTDALEAVALEATAPTEWYLVSLLGDFAHARLPDRPLALVLAGAQDAEPASRVRALKEVGDTSLYVAGFFAESLDRQLVDVDYYVGLGASAYHQLAGRMAGNLTQVYRELAEQFPRFVDVLAEISEQSSLTSNLGVVQLYERWLRTGSEWIERKLREKGVVPKKSDVQ